MRKLVLLCSGAIMCASSVAAEGLIVSGFLEFEAYHTSRVITSSGLGALSGTEGVVAGGDPVSLNNSENNSKLDFGVDLRLQFDYSNSTKAGLEYGAHFEIDAYQSDIGGDIFVGGVDTGVDFVDASQVLEPDSLATGEYVLFNDGYVYISSAIGKVEFGDVEPGGLGDSNLLAPTYTGVLNYGLNDEDATTHADGSESEVIKYSNSLAGADIELSVDDDSNWSAGLGYTAGLGASSLTLGVTLTEDAYEATVTGSMGNFEAQATQLEIYDTDFEYSGFGVAYKFLGAGKAAYSYDEDNLGNSNKQISTILFLDRGLYVGVAYGVNQDDDHSASAGAGVRF